jgi:hypothetical protein
MLVSKINTEVREQNEINFVTREQELTAIVNFYAGSPRLKIEMQRLKINYVKVCRGAVTKFILRHKDIKGGKLIVKL